MIKWRHSFSTSIAIAIILPGCPNWEPLTPCKAMWSFLFQAYARYDDIFAKRDLNLAPPRSSNWTRLKQGKLSFAGRRCPSLLWIRRVHTVVDFHRDIAQVNLKKYEILQEHGTACQFPRKERTQNLQEKSTKMFEPNRQEAFEQNV